MKTSEFQNEKTQIDEGPCDIALPSEIKKMTADQFSKYALWKKECEEEEAMKSGRNDESDEDKKDEDVWTKNFKRNSEKRLRQKKRRDGQQADEFEEGHRTLPPIDTERYTERKGLEGPIRARNGRVVYYDPKEGQYYDPDTDIYISNDEWEAMNESHPGRDGPDYQKGDLVVLNGRSYILDEFDDGIWWATDDDGGDIEFIPGTEEHHEPGHYTESEDDNVSNALDTMRQHFHDYNQDPSNRWEKYNQYRNERRQISQRAKRLK
jgi:hypothetical protein